MREHAAVGERLRRLAQRVDERVVAGAAVADALREPLEGQRRALEARQPRRRRRPAPARPPIAATHTSSVNTSRSHISAALASSPSNHTTHEPGPQLPRQRLRRQRRGRREQLAHAVEVMRDHPIGEVGGPPGRAPGCSSPAGGWKWMPFGAASSTSPVERARRRPVRARERARERRHRPVARGRRRRPPPTPRPLRSCHAARSSSSRRRSATGDSPVAAASSRSRWSREKCARAASDGAVGRLVERAEHEVDQFAQAVRHAHMLIVFDVSAGRARRRAPPCTPMASWSEFAAAAPELAERVQERFDAHKHKTMATLRKDGAPRISGTECQFKDGELWIGSMWKARQGARPAARPALRDAQRHRGPRAAGAGEAKIAGTAEEIVDEEEVKRAQRRGRRQRPEPPLPARRHRGLDRRPQRGQEDLVIEVWTPERGVRTIERE